MNRDRDGRNDLHQAAAQGQIRALEAGLADGQDPGLPDNQGHTPLHFAAQQGQAEAARWLLDHGVDVDLKDGQGNTPLWGATFGNTANPELVQMLLSAGADPDSQNNAGRSPRDVALTFDKPGVSDLFK
jgi:ankyrin repeat protein